MKARGASSFVAAVTCATAGAWLAHCGGDDSVNDGAAGSGGDDAGDAAAAPDTTGTGGDDGGASDGAGGSDARPLGPPRVYTGSGDGNVRVFTFDADAGALGALDTTPAGANPSFLAVDSSTRFLYAVDETRSQVNAFSIDGSTGKLTSLGAPVSSGGSGPAHVSLDRAGRFVLVANYGGGTAAVLARAADGTLTSPSTTIPFGALAHTHEILADPSNTFVLVPNLGLDSVAVLRLDASGALRDAGAAAAGDGPRHLAFDAANRHVYVIDEIASAVVVFAFDATTGALTKEQTISTLPPGFSGSNTGAEIQLAPDGRHLYASNRGDDSVVVFDVSTTDGTLTWKTRVATGGHTPRHFSIEPTGRWLFVANQSSGSVVVMKLDAATGIPVAVGSPVAVPSPAYVGLVYLP